MGRAAAPGSGVGRTRNVVSPASLSDQFEQPYGPMGPPTLLTISVLRYMNTYGLTHETLALVSVVQRGQELQRHFQDADHRRRRAEFADDRLPVPAIAVLSGDRWRRRIDPGRGRACQGLPAEVGLLLGTGKSVETPMVSQMEDFTSSRAFRVAGLMAFVKGRHHAQRRRPSDDLRRLCSSAYLRPRRSSLCAARRGRHLHRRAQHPPAENCRSTPMAAVFPTCIPAYTHCGRACARCAAPPLPRSPAPRSRSATASAACLPPPARSSCQTSRVKILFRGGSAPIDARRGRSIDTRSQ